MFLQALHCKKIFRSNSSVKVIACFSPTRKKCMFKFHEPFDR